MFSKATRSRPAASRPAPAGADWSPYGRLEDAAGVYFLHADVALDAIEGVLGRRRVRGFTLERVVDLTEAGASVWQEAAVCDGRRLILWHSEELADERHPAARCSTPPSRCCRSTRSGTSACAPWSGTDERGRRVDRGVYLVLATAMPHELSAVQADPDSPLPVASARFRPEAFRFSKSLDDGGPGQIARLIDFGRLLGRLVRA